MDNQTLLALLPAYALDALDGEETRQVAAMLPNDPDAQALLADYQAAATVLLLTSPVRQPPPDLQTKLLARARRLQAAPPTTPQRVLRLNWRVTLAGVAALLVVVIGLALVLRPSDDEPTVDPTPERAAVYATLMAHPQSTTIALVPDVATGAEGELVVRADTQQVMLRLSQLPPLTADQAYQLWAIDDEEGFTSIGVYHWYNLGQTTYYVDLSLPDPLGSYQRLGMSLEPLSGSPLVTEPSGPRLFNIPLRTE